MVNGCEVRVDLHYKEACLSDIIAAFSSEMGLGARPHAAEVLHRLKKKGPYKQLGIDDKYRLIFPNDYNKLGVVTVSAEEFSRLTSAIKLVDSRFRQNYDESFDFDKLVNGSQTETLDGAAGVPSAPPLPLTQDLSSVEHPPATSVAVQESLSESVAGSVMGTPVVSLLLPSNRSREDVDFHREMALISKAIAEKENERLDMENVRLDKENVRLDKLIKLAELGVDVTKICSASK